MAQWDGRSRGTVFGYRIFIFLIQYGGVKPAYFLLRFVTFYYFLFASKPKKILINFYQKALGVNINTARNLCRRNFYFLGQTLVDRTAFLLGKGNVFSHDFENENFLVEMQEQKKGGILISAHIGNWETAGNLLKSRVSSTIHVLMVDAEAKKLKQYLDSSTGGSQFSIITVKDDLSHIVKVNNALAANDLIAMHGDRYLPGTKTIELDFLGGRAKFPYGPFLLASRFNAPVTFVFALKANDFHYELSATMPITEKKLPEEIAALYINELEKKVKKYPEQWFNYYDFYSQ
ncbi:MAG TPA: lipid A biosynthesis acyltransferase [Bacteroidia bacterium]|nr:lipid A biosynthesis acyltransferase [Bacteroidia bacterium]HMU18760.1 lipid A biosynthesis acyltransferase [Bacteroidia bacterium]